MYVAETRLTSCTFFVDSTYNSLHKTVDKIVKVLTVLFRC